MDNCKRALAVFVWCGLTAGAFHEAAKAGSGEQILAHRIARVHRFQPVNAATVSIAGHVPPFVRDATPVPRPPTADSEILYLTLVLNSSDADGMKSYLAELNDQKSTNFRNTLTATEVGNRFGPTQQQYSGLVTFLTQSGLAIVQTSANRLAVTVKGARQDVEKAFNTNIADYEVDGRIVRAPTVEPGLASDLAGLVQHISGLTNSELPHPNASPSPATTQSIGTAYNSFQFGGGTLDGTGQTIGVTAFDNLNPSDIQDWLLWQKLSKGRYNTNVSIVDVGGGTTPGGGNGQIEVEQDVDALLSLAPGAKIIVFDAPNNGSVSTLTEMQTAAEQVQAAQGGMGGIVSNSWYGACEGDPTTFSASEANALNNLLAAYIVSGLTVFNSSGDNGANCVGPTVGPTKPFMIFANSLEYPADVPNGVAVGGTTLQVTSGGPGGNNIYSSEVWWNGSGSGLNQIGGGYGLSQYFPVPSYQLFNIANTRSVPDVAADADPNTGIIIYFQGKQRLQGGTSIATPIWAAVWALATQAEIANQVLTTCNELGNVVPCTRYLAPISAAGGLLYSFASQNPDTFQSLAQTSSPGFTGLGTPNISHIASILSLRPYVIAVLPQLLFTPVPGEWPGTEVSILGYNFVSSGSSMTNFLFVSNHSTEATGVRCASATLCSARTPLLISPTTYLVQASTNYGNVLTTLGPLDPAAYFIVSPIINW